MPSWESDRQVQSAPMTPSDCAEAPAAWHAPSDSYSPNSLCEGEAWAAAAGMSAPRASAVHATIRTTSLLRNTVVLPVGVDGSKAAVSLAGSVYRVPRYHTGPRK